MSQYTTGRPPSLFVETGQRFTRLVVIADTRKVTRSYPGGIRAAVCRCDCGGEVTVAIAQLLSGKTRSCGCLKRESAAVTVRNERIEQWRRSPENRQRLIDANPWSSPEGREVMLQVTRSAEHRERAASQMTIHGLEKHPLYNTWNGMMHRCYNDRRENFKWYGGRGIQVCPEWHDVVAFIAWIEANLGARPDGMTLDRYPDPDGNYEPGNVRWATWVQQARNRSAS